MLERSWLIGERHGAGVQMFVQCGLCAARLPVEEDDDPRELLRAHVYCAHGTAANDHDAAD